MKTQILQIIKFSFILYALSLFAMPMANAQNKKWPISVYGSEGGHYDGAPVINGYLIVNSRKLKGLTHRTYLKGTSLDTLVNSDTLYGHIKLYSFTSKPRHLDIELPKSNVVSVPCSYILSITGSSLDHLYYAEAPPTKWVILPANRYPPFRRLVAQKNNVFIYDSSNKDTIEREYACPMTLRNGYEEIEIDSDLFGSTIKALRKFIKKRYGIALDLSKAENKDAHFLINYIAEQEDVLFCNFDLYLPVLQLLPLYQL